MSSSTHKLERIRVTDRDIGPEFCDYDYTDATDGPYMEANKIALVWHYEDVDPDVGSFQTKELQNQLLNLLAKEPQSVKSGHKIVEVNPQVR